MILIFRDPIGTYIFMWARKVENGAFYLSSKQVNRLLLCGFVPHHEVEAYTLFGKKLRSNQELQERPTPLLFYKTSGRIRDLFLL